MRHPCGCNEKNGVWTYVCEEHQDFTRTVVQKDKEIRALRDKLAKVEELEMQRDQDAEEIDMLSASLEKAEKAVECIQAYAIVMDDGNLNGLAQEFLAAIRDEKP